MSYMDQYRKLQQFTSVKEFDQYRSNLFYTIKDKLSRGSLAVWNTLSQRSIEVPGVCWIQINTIAEVAGVSRSTVERAIRLFKKLGIIKVMETIRPVKGGDGANVYVFQKLGEGAGMKGREVPKNPTESKGEPSISENDSNIFLINKKNINHLNVKRKAYIKGVPKSLQHYQAIFGKHLKDLYGRVWLAAKKLGISVEQDVMQLIGFKVMEQLKQYIKDGKQLSDEQLCKLAYTISHNQLTQRPEISELLEWNSTMERFFKLTSK